MLPSENVPVAAYCWPLPAAKLLLAGVTPMLLNVALPTVNVVAPVTAAKVARIEVAPGTRARTKPCSPAALLALATLATLLDQVA